MTAAGSSARLAEQIRHRARALGFAAVGFAPARPLTADGHRLERWLAAGMQGTMSFLSGPVAREDPRALLPHAQTVIVCVARHSDGEPDPPASAAEGRIARFARGADYHVVLRARLERLAHEIEGMLARPLLWRAAVDSAPLLERATAVAAGVGFIGKSSLLITPGVGSFTVLGELLVDLELPADAPLPERCGRCDRCITACPTGAIVAPRVVDARRCISYLTIEHRGAVATEHLGRTDRWIFGCDRCQEVCPHNHPTPRRASLPTIAELRPTLAPAISLAELLLMRAGAYRRLVRQRAFGRVPAPAWRRNAALAALAALDVGQPLDPELRRALEQAQRCDRDATVRDLAARALAVGSE